MSTFSVILVAAGRSSRFKDEHYKKPFAVLNRKAVWLHSADRFLKRSDVKQVIVVIAPEDRENFLTKFGANLAVLGIEIVLGGEQRHHSVANGLAKVQAKCDYVAVHDAARPCISDEEIEAVFSAAAKSQAAILATPVTATLKRSTDGKQIAETLDRHGLWQALTPQVFCRQWLVDAFAQIGDRQPTDEAQLMEQMGRKVSLVVGSPLNIKITTKRDLALAAACLEAMPKPRFDAPLHPFADDQLWR